MSFASIVFIFIFLPISLTIFYLLPRGNWRLAALILSSLVFFAWTDIRHLPVLVFFVLFNYGIGRLIWHVLARQSNTLRRVLLWVGIGGNLSFLFYYKYLGFFGEMISSLSGGRFSFQQQAFLLGVSYMTFSGISYVLDVHKKVKPAEKNLVRLASYLIMFPKLIQGPIALYRDLHPQLDAKQIQVEDLHWGIRRFIIGLAKKVILADTLLVAADRVFSANPATLSAGAAWVGLTAYALVIYFDFAGYTDMALGIGRLFGFRLPENFNFPYISRSITDFWRRWHISLTHWFRTYVFIPLEFARRRDKFLRQQSNILIVFFLTGLWHGASWNFVIWGGYFGLILALESSGLGKKLKNIPVFFQHVYTLVIVLLGWIMFRITDLQIWPRFIGALFGANGQEGVQTLRSLNLIIYVPVVLLGILFSTPLLQNIEKIQVLRLNTRQILFDILCLGIFLVTLSFVLANGFQAFMYAQF